MNQPTVAEIRRLVDEADEGELAALERSLAGDDRSGIKRALRTARARMDARHAEEERLHSLYEFQSSIASSHDAHVVVGLDEVGRGPLAGPLCVGAVLLPDKPEIPGLNDSKQVPARLRPSVAACVKEVALAWNITFVEPHLIDEWGMVKALKEAFASSLRSIEQKGFDVDIALLDGNPLHFDPRELSIVKGDSKCASIAAASVIAKVERDSLMDSLNDVYPGYGFARNKGYGTNEHREAIRIHGLTDVHRKSFCSEFLQESLF